MFYCTKNDKNSVEVGRIIGEWKVHKPKYQIQSSLITQFNGNPYIGSGPQTNFCTCFYAYFSFG